MHKKGKKKKSEFSPASSTPQAQMTYKRKKNCKHKKATKKCKMC